MFFFSRGVRLVNFTKCVLSVAESISSGVAGRGSWESPGLYSPLPAPWQSTMCVSVCLSVCLS